MNIAHIAPPWIAVPPHHYGGAEFAIANLIEEQVAQGHEVTLFSPGDARTPARLVSFFATSLIAAGVPWHAHLKAFYHYSKAFEHVRKQAYDLLHLHLSSSSDLYVCSLAALMAIQTPLVMTLHSQFPFDHAPCGPGKAEWTGDADRYYLDWLTRIPLVALSKSARAHAPFPLNFVAAIHYGLPLSTFRPTTSRCEGYLAWIGRIVPEKGPHHAIAAAKALDIPLVLAGEADRHLPETVRYFEEQIKPHIDGRRVRYIGPVNLSQKLDLLSRARGFLNPIEWEEPFGLVMIEAMAAGCPVISFARGAAPELIAHGSSGFLVHNVEEMTGLIPRLGSLDRRAVRAHVEQHFSVQLMAERYTEVYRRVISGQAGRVRTA